MLLNILFALLTLHSSSIYCAKNGKKLPSDAVVPPSPALSPPNFENLNLLKRPLNAYIVENGKHAKVQSKSIQIGEANDTNSSSTNILKYHIARPPFAIKQRGAVILFNTDDNGTFWSDWHRGHPSIVQMMAANGHFVVAPELPEKQAEKIEQPIWKIIEREMPHKMVVVGRGQRQIVELINDQLDGIFADQIDAIVLLDGSAEELKVAKAINPDQKPAIIMLRQHKGTEAEEANGQQQQNGKVKTVVVDLGEAGGMENRQKVAQIMVNLLDCVHPRR